jgi:hypothetical protein
VPDNPGTLEDLLPALLTVERAPMTLADHAVFGPLFSTWVPRTTVVVAGRQIGKTHQICGRILLQAVLEPGHKTLTVLPLEQQADRLSHLIFRPMTLDSPLRHELWRDRGRAMSVRMHRYDNGSITHFLYATDDPDRIRGLTGTRWLYIDEAQDMDATIVPVLIAATDAWKHPTTLISGTAKTKDTYLYDNWSNSSQGVWHVRCGTCGFDNVCCLEPDGHLIALIGPPRDDVSEARPGTLCKRCRAPVNPRYGRWVHRYPEKCDRISGYHVPQVIMPGHFASASKWGDLVEKMNGGMGYTQGKFYNEVLGEPFDMALKLVGRDDLRRAAQTVGANAIEDARVNRSRYPVVFLGVDWGGGGEDGVSRTKVAACGLYADGRVHVFYGAQFPPSTDSVAEAKEIVKIAGALSVTGIAHDFNGAGTVAESVLTHLGWPVNRLAPMRYHSYPGARMLSRMNQPGARPHYQLDKGRTLQFLCNAIRYDRVRFFDYDYIDEHRPGLLNDFVHLVGFTVDTPSGSVYRVRKQSASVSDDFAHAVNYGCCAVWEAANQWPNLAGGATREAPTF